MVINENKQYLKNVEDFVNKNPDTVCSLFIDRIIGFGDILVLYDNYSNTKFKSKQQVIEYLRYVRDFGHCYPNLDRRAVSYNEITQFVQFCDNLIKEHK